MSDTYANFYREPSKPHQCVHFSDEDGTQCRATAMHNEMMCYHHRPDAILPVIENEPFLLENLDTREAIQRALGQVARQLACNRMDFQRAKLLVQVITAAMRNLPPHPRSTDSANLSGLHAERREQHEVPVILSEARSAQSKDPDAFHPAPAGRTIPPPNPADLAADVPPTPERDYTSKEKDYFYKTIFALGFEPKTHARPASVTDDDIIARVNDCRRRYGLPLLIPKRNPSGTLLYIHERPTGHHLQPLPADTQPSTTEN